MGVRYDSPPLTLSNVGESACSQVVDRNIPTRRATVGKIAFRFEWALAPVPPVVAAALVRARWWHFLCGGINSHAIRSIQRTEVQ